MKHSVFMGALESTAKIAGCAAIFGAAVCVANDADKDSDSATMDSETSDSASSVDTDGANGVVGDLDVDDDGDLYTENTGDCDDGDSTAYPGGEGDDCGLSACRASVADTFAVDTPMPDANTETCCQLIANYYDQHYDEMMEWEERNQCCDLLEWQGSMACTPWGPPVPPKMPNQTKERV